MKTLLKLEELAQFLACALALFLLDVAWWIYPLLLLGPDISMLGYLVNARFGAITYNLLHHKGVAVMVLLMGVAQGFTLLPPLAMLMEGIEAIVIGLILYGHASMDRIFGYGLKFGDSFQHTHLGWIGKMKAARGERQVGE